MIVSRCVFVKRSVERIELPSTKQLMIWLRRSFDKRFIVFSNLSRYIVAYLWPQVKNKVALWAQKGYNIFIMRVETLKFRVTPEEKAAFQKAADSVGLKLSAWIRERLRRASIADLRDINEIPDFIKTLKRDVNSLVELC